MFTIVEQLEEVNNILNANPPAQWKLTATGDLRTNIVRWLKDYCYYAWKEVILNYEADLLIAIEFDLHVILPHVYIEKFVSDHVPEGIANSSFVLSTAILQL